jgi:hypothetical protein
VVNEPVLRDGSDVEDRYAVYEFVPKGDAPPGRVVGRPAPRALRR